jgi:hypothetical protein
VFNVTIPYTVHTFLVDTADFGTNYFAILIYQNSFSDNRLDLIRKSSFFTIGVSTKLVYASDNGIGDGAKRAIYFNNGPYSTPWATNIIRVYKVWT